MEENGGKMTMDNDFINTKPMPPHVSELRDFLIPDRDAEAKHLGHNEREKKAVIFESYQWLAEQYIPFREKVIELLNHEAKRTEIEVDTLDKQLQSLRLRLIEETNEAIKNKEIVESGFDSGFFTRPWVIYGIGAGLGLAGLLVGLSI